MGKEDTAHMYNGRLLSHKKEWNLVICQVYIIFIGEPNTLDGHIYHSKLIKSHSKLIKRHSHFLRQNDINRDICSYTQQRSLGRKTSGN